MSTKRFIVLLGLVAILAAAVACAAPTAPPPQVVKEQVTVIVAGTPKVVEATKVVEVPKVVTATPLPPKVQDTFIFGAQGEPVCLDPAIITDGISGRITNQIFEGLVKFDKDTTNVVPSLAEKWTVSEDGKVWTFTLRKGVKFHDGTDFNADAVVKNFDYWQIPRIRYTLRRSKPDRPSSTLKPSSAGLTTTASSPRSKPLIPPPFASR